MTGTQQPYGTLPDGREVTLYTLVNAHGLRARICDFGALLVSMETPDREGNLADLTHGFDLLDGWLHNPAYFGASIGRFGNRIAAGKFLLDGKLVTLALNSSSANIPCHLHGGKIGFHQKLWQARWLSEASVELTYQSPAGEEGYPGNLSCSIIYTLNDDDELIWQASATTDATTVVNLVHHSYWNLTGNPTSSILDHHLLIAGDAFLPTDAGQIPTGERASVAGTPMDFTQGKIIGEDIDADFTALKFGGGYDHAWLLDDAVGVKLAARLHDPKSGRMLEVLTDQPTLQCYTGNCLDGTIIGKNAVAYPFRSAICLETQAYPDAPNHPQFPSTVLHPGEQYQHTLVHRFSVK